MRDGSRQTSSDGLEQRILQSLDGGVKKSLLELGFISGSAVNNSNLLQVLHDLTSRGVVRRSSDGFQEVYFRSTNGVSEKSKQV